MSAAQRLVRRTRSADSPVSVSQQYLVIGQIVAPRGLRGELKVRVETEDPGRFADLESVYLGPDRARYAVAGARVHNGFALLVLKGVADRDAADALRGLTVYVDQEQALPLGVDEYYQFQLEGLQVRTQDGLELGRLTEVLETGANDVYVVAGSAGELLLPAIKDVILTIDIAGGTITVRVPDGLTD
jgi:16S rRNA processing protein RimM